MFLPVLGKTPKKQGSLRKGVIIEDFLKELGPELHLERF